MLKKEALATFTVHIKWSDTCPFKTRLGHATETLHGITEIHYNYRHSMPYPGDKDDVQIAFEPSGTYPMRYIAEFEAMAEVGK